MSLSFLSAFVADPQAIGSIWPSSRFLVAEMLRQADLKPVDRVVELGAGTGPVTAELTTHQGPLFALEPNAALAARCRSRCPGVDVVEDTAENLPQLLKERAWPHADVIVSGLPFAAWNDARQDQVLDAIANIMIPESRFITFTYRHSQALPAAKKLRAKLERRFHNLTISPTVWRCIPPARVYAITGLRSRTPA